MRKLGAIVFALLVLIGLAAAQVVPTGRITGRVVDDQGNPLPGVGVVAESVRLVGQSTTVTDDTGTYRLFSLPSGTYAIRFTLQGFKTVTRREIILQLEQNLTLNITMEPSALEEEVTVVGQSPLIDVRSTTKGTTMTKEVFMALPRSRSFDGLLSTMPGVQYDANTGGLSVDGASGAENVWYIDGTNITDVHRGTRSQSIVMEQLDEVKVTASGYQAEFGGAVGGVVSVISRSGGNEFHGDFYGYYDNNSLLMEGHARDYLRANPYVYPYVAEYINNDVLYFNDGKDRDNRQRYEGVFSLGGYIIKDRLWFFGSFNPIVQTTDAKRFNTSDPGDPTIDKNYDPRQGRPLYDFSQKNNYWYGQAKVTAQLFTGMRISLSFNNNWRNYRGSIPSVTGVWSKTSPYQDEGMDYPNWMANGQIDYTVSNNLLLSLRGGYFHMNTGNQQVKMESTYYYFNRTNIQAQWPEIPANLQHYAGWTNFGGSTREYVRWIQDRISANLDATYYMNLGGEHAWKAGVQFVRIPEDVNAAVQHPLVNMYWGIGYGMPDGTWVQGKYGYYTTRGDFFSPYGWFWKNHCDQWAIYLQDAWTIGQKLTLNLGVRLENEYIPSGNTVQEEFKDVKPIQFGFFDKVAPRLGIIWDVFGDSSLKTYATYGLYYDVMKTYISEGSYGGFNWCTSYYTFDDYDWTKIAASGKIDDRASQEGAGKWMGARNWRVPSFDSTDPDIKPVVQSELSFGADKKLTEEITFGARVVWKHLIRTIEDIGAIGYDEKGALSEIYIIGNPGEGVATPKSEGGWMADEYWPAPKPKREYWGINLSLEKRFSNNWQAGLNYTWSRIYGNYSGLSSSDEGGRDSPNTNRFWDLWFERYDLNGRPLDGVLQYDRSHYLKGFGSYSFPFGLTIGTVIYARSGLPRNTAVGFNDMTVYAEGYFDTGKRLPFAVYGDIYLDYTLRFLKRYRLGINLTVYNFWNAKYITGYDDTPVLQQYVWSDEKILSKPGWKSEIDAHERDPLYGLASGYNSPFTARLGLRFSF